jgi:hypothetical protein
MLGGLNFEQLLSLCHCPKHIQRHTTPGVNSACERTECSRINNRITRQTVQLPFSSTGVAFVLGRRFAPDTSATVVIVLLKTYEYDCVPTWCGSDAHLCPTRQLSAHCALVNTCEPQLQLGGGCRQGVVDPHHVSREIGRSRTFPCDIIQFTIKERTGDFAEHPTTPRSPSAQVSKCFRLRIIAHAHVTPHAPRYNLVVTEVRERS